MDKRRLTAWRLAPPRKRKRRSEGDSRPAAKLPTMRIRLVNKDEAPPAQEEPETVPQARVEDGSPSDSGASTDSMVEEGTPSATGASADPMAEEGTPSATGATTDSMAEEGTPSATGASTDPMVEEGHTRCYWGLHGPYGRGRHTQCYWGLHGRRTSVHRGGRRAVCHQ